MKLGLIISGVIVVVLAVVVGVALFYRPVDKPTYATRAEVLRAATLPMGAMPVSASEGGVEGGGDASQQYREAIQAWRGNADASAAGEALASAADAGGVNEGFLGPVFPVEGSLSEDPMQGLPQMISDIGFEAQRRWEAGDQAGAVRLARGLFVFGKRAFDRGEVYEVRWLGLLAMDRGSGMLWAWEDAPGVDREAAKAWYEATGRTIKAWRDKMAMISTPKPHVGDLLNIANHDQDRSFRAYAVIWLGSAKFAPGSPGNQAAIQGTIDAARASDDDLMRRAGQAAEDLTLERRNRLGGTGG